MEVGPQLSSPIRSAWMRHFDFSDDVLEEIQRDRFKHPTRLVQERMSYCQMLWTEDFQAADFLIPSS